MKKNRDLILYIGSAIATLIVWFSCNQISFTPEPKTIDWIEVKTGFTDSTRDLEPPNYISKYKNGFQVQWPRVAEVDYYEVRVSQEPITARSWDKAIFAAKVDNADTGKTVMANIELKPEISINQCSGCKACFEACPQKAITMVNNKAFIDSKKCTGCGVCFERCTYNAISVLSLGKYFYFAVRGYSAKRSVDNRVAATNNAFKMQYTNWSVDSLGDMVCGRCGDSCWILIKRVGPGCPVDAIKYYTIPPDSGLMYIDQSKCIYCGQCYIQCITTMGFHSIRREVVSR